VQIIDNIPVWAASIDEGALKQIKTCYYIFGHAALMADHHKGYGVPIGGVIAHETLVSPSGVGYDIGCGNKAVLTDAPAEDARKNIAKIMDDVFRTISFGLARTNRAKWWSTIFSRTTMPGRSPRARTAPPGG
jgi:tRNA-splicing ligase RtcB